MYIWKLNMNSWHKYYKCNYWKTVAWGYAKRSEDSGILDDGEMNTWQTLRVRAENERVQFFLNGVLVAARSSKSFAFSLF